VSDFLELPDLASERLGGAALAANDEFFAPKENLIRQTDPAWKEGLFTDRGKWMDGWETRRRRTPGHDWCLLRLGAPGILRGVVVDTTHFKGNHPERCSLEACALPGAPDLERLTARETRWVTVLPESKLEADARNLFAVDAPWRFTHLRLNVFPDGGVARLRAHGEALPDWVALARAGGEIDLAALEHGGRVVACSDMFFGSRHNLILPGTGRDMGDGWETRRRRGPGHDWTILRLGAEARIRRIEVDTTHFKGNAPESCSLEGSRAQDASEGDWTELLSRTPLQPHARHRFEDEVRVPGPVTHVRFNIHPDGGVSRLRLFGTPDPEGWERLGLERLNALAPDEAEAELLRCCGSSAWARRMAEVRPFASRPALEDAADLTWGALPPAGWRAAFAAHPRIGERAAQAWSREEQAAAAAAPEAIRARLAEAQRAYEARFGHLFIVCASGRGAEEILTMLERRLANTADLELRVAAEEQRKITRLRLDRLLHPEARP